MSMNKPNWGDYPPLPKGKAADHVIRQEAKEHESSFMDILKSERIHDRNGQVFAVFGSHAHEILEAEFSARGRTWVYTPAKLDGQVFQACPDEGQSRILYWCCDRTGGDGINDNWYLTWVNLGGWIYTRELGLSNQEIMDNIADEVDAGATPLTGGKAGWV